jgi:hypothetical protein
MFEFVGFEALERLAEPDGCTGFADGQPLDPSDVYSRRIDDVDRRRVVDPSNPSPK